MTSSYLNELHDVICVNLFPPQVNGIPPQRTGVKHPSSTTEASLTSVSLIVDIGDKKQTRTKNVFVACVPGIVIIFAPYSVKPLTNTVYERISV